MWSKVEDRGYRERVRQDQQKDGQYGRTRESLVQPVPDRHPPTDLAELYDPENPIRARTRTAILAALAAGAKSHSQLYRTLTPEFTADGFFPLALDDLVRGPRVRVEPGTGDGMPPILSLKEVLS